jgi:hypothetical protein
LIRRSAANHASGSYCGDDFLHHDRFLVAVFFRKSPLYKARALNAAPVKETCMSREDAASPKTSRDIGRAPVFTDSASHIDAARKSVEDAAPIFLGLWLSYLGVSAYLVITIAAVTHKDLFLGSTVKLPLLSDTPLPIVGFFVLAPISFVILHAYILVHLRILAAKIRVLDRVEHQGGVQQGTNTFLEWQLPANIFVHLIAKRPEFSRQLNFISLAIAWSTLAIGPIFLLLLAQAQFLPIHYAPVTWLHRFLIVIDFAFLWWLWPTALVLEGQTPRPAKLGRRALALASFILLAFWLCSATFPGEWPDAYVGNRMPMRDWLFSGPYDEEKQSRTSYFSNTLVLPGFSGLEALGIDEATLLSAKRVIVRKGGHFEGAIFRGADLRTINLENAQLQGADFYQANLQSAQFYQADLTGAELYQARLQLASFDSAELQAADLRNADLRGAWLWEAHLRGASLQGAALQGAALAGAQLQGASLKNAMLQGADFAGATLAGVDVSGAEMWRTQFKRAALAAVLEDGSRDEPISEPEFQALKQAIIKAPQGEQTSAALVRISNLDPALTTASSAGTELMQARVDASAHQTALADQLKNLACAPDNKDAYSLVRGLIRDPGTTSPIRDTGPQACGLVEAILSGRCPVSALLTSRDKAALKGLVSEVRNGKCES